MKNEEPAPSEGNFDIEEFKRKYQEISSDYIRLGKNLTDVLKGLLQEKQIPFLDITTRQKDLESAIGKIQRKDYSNPLSEIEDWCGIRIICYYPSDIEKINAILDEEFIVSTKENTAERLASNEFGYRSTHFIIKIKDDWLNTPNYRGLKELKAEVQVRTILMHAWAEIEHKLAYKNTDQVPNTFKRVLYRLSAKFEEADEQFEGIRQGLENYREQVKNEMSSNATAFKSKELNLDTLIVLLDATYPTLKKDDEKVAKFLAEISSLGLTMSDLTEAIAQQNSILKHIKISNLTQLGGLRHALDISNEKHYEHRKRVLESDSPWAKRAQLGRRLLGKR